MNEDRKRLDLQRSQAAKFFVANYSREERYLKIFERDSASFISSRDYLMKKDTANQYYFDFLVFFDSLKEKMKEFRWSGDFLQTNGINFKELRKLYFAVA